MSRRDAGLRSGVRCFLGLLVCLMALIWSYVSYFVKSVPRRAMRKHQDETMAVFLAELRKLLRRMEQMEKQQLAGHRDIFKEQHAEIRDLHTRDTALLSNQEKREPLIDLMDGNPNTMKVPSAAVKHTTKKLPAELAKEVPQILKSHNQPFSATGDASNTTSAKDSHKLRTSVSWWEPFKAIQEALKSLKRSLMDKDEETIRGLQDEVETLSHSLAQTSKLVEKHKKMSSLIKHLKRKKASLIRSGERKTFSLKVKSRQLKLLKENIDKKKKENLTLNQCVKKLKEQMSTLDTELRNVKKENEKLLDTTKQNIKAVEESNTKLRASIREKEQDCYAIKEELHSREQLLKEKDKTARQLIHDIRLTLQKFLAGWQQKDGQLLPQKQSQQQVLPSQVEHLQEELSQKLGRFHHHAPPSPDSDIPDFLKNEDELAGGDSAAGAESRPQWALNSATTTTTTTAGQGTMTPCGEPHLLQPVPTTITTESGTANIQQLAAEPKPSTTGMGLTELAHASGDQKILATKVLGRVKCYNVKNRCGFITTKETQDDIFVHQSAIQKNNPWKYLPSVGDGELVEFDVVEGKKGVEAANVTGPGGVAVQGSKYVPERTRSRRYPRRRAPRPHYPHGCLPTDSDSSDEAADGQACPRWRRVRRRRLPRCYQPPTQDSIPPVQGDMQGAQGMAEGDQPQPLEVKVDQGCRPSRLYRPRHHSQSEQDSEEADSEDQEETRGQQRHLLRHPPRKRPKRCITGSTHKKL